MTTNNTNNTAKKTSEDQHKDYRFLDYRLDQLGNQIETGLTRIEEEQKQYNLQVMNTLQKLQEGQNKTYENIAQLRQRQIDMEDKLHCIDKLREATSRNSERIKNNNQSTNHRIDVIQKILIAVATVAVSALFSAVISIMQLILLQ